MNLHAENLVRLSNELGLNLTYNQVTVGDGNCFFHALKNQIDSRPNLNISLQGRANSSTAFNLRKAIVNFSYSHLDLLLNETDKSLEECLQFLDNMSTNGVWAENEIILMAAKFLNCNIFLLNYPLNVSAPITRIFVDDNLTLLDDCIILGYVSGCHFQSLIPNKNQTSGIQNNSKNMASNKSPTHISPKKPDQRPQRPSNSQPIPPMSGTQPNVQTKSPLPQNLSNVQSKSPQSDCSAQSEPYNSIPVGSKEPLKVSCSEMDVDGLIIINHLPLVVWLETASIDLVGFKMFSVGDKLRTLNTRRFDNFHSTLIGYSGGMPFYLISNLEQETFASLLFRFVAVSKQGALGSENGWLSDNCHSIDEVKNQIKLCNRSILKISPQILFDFRQFVSSVSTEENPKFVYGAIIWLGMKMPFKIFISNFQKYILQGQYLASTVHLGIEFSCVTEKAMLAVSGNIYNKFHHKESSFWFHPLALVDAFSCIFNEGNKLLSYLEYTLKLKLTKLRIYNPQLMHCRSPEIRSKRCLLTAANLLGWHLVTDGPYKELCQSARLYTDSVRSGIFSIINNGGTLRLELVTPEVSCLLKMDTQKMRNLIRTFMNDEKALVGIDCSEIPLDQLHNALKIISTPTPFQNLHHVIAAEAYLSFMVDGGTLRLFYPGIKAALGKTIGEAVSTSEIIISPKVSDFSHVHWSHFQTETLAKQLSFYFCVDQKIINKFLLLLQHNDFKNDGLKCARIIKMLESERCGIPEIDGFTVEYHRNRGSLVGSITPHELIKVLLCVRPRKGIKGLQATIMQSFLSKINANANNEGHSKLLQMIFNEIHVWPHSIPILSRDRTERFWVVGPDPNKKSIHIALQWIYDNLPQTMNRIPQLATLSCPSAQFKIAWELLECFIFSSHGSRYNPNILRTLLLTIFFTVEERLRKNDTKYHPFINWGEWRIVMKNALPESLNLFVEFNLLTMASKNDQSIHTLFCTHQIPNDVYGKIRDFRNFLINKKILKPPLVLPAIIETNAAFLEPEIENPEDNEAIENIIQQQSHKQKRARRTNIQILLEEASSDSNLERCQNRVRVVRNYAPTFQNQSPSKKLKSRSNTIIQPSSSAQQPGNSNIQGSQSTYKPRPRSKQFQTLPH